MRADQACLTSDLDTIEMLQEIEVKVGPAVLAIRDGANAVVKLCSGYGCDGFVLGFAQFVEVRFLVCNSLARVENALRAQKGADVVGAVDTVRERHCGSCGSKGATRHSKICEKDETKGKRESKGTRPG